MKTEWQKYFTNLPLTLFYLLSSLLQLRGVAITTLDILG